MTTVPVGSSAGPHAQARAWRMVAILLVAAFFLEAVFAGAMMSGFVWARAAHRLTAGMLIAGSLGAGLVCLVTLRRIPHGLRLAVTLLLLAAAALLQAALGAMSARGAQLIWIHVPLGVALVGLAGQVVAGTRKLGGD